MISDFVGKDSEVYICEFCCPLFIFALLDDNILVLCEGTLFLPLTLFLWMEVVFPPLHSLLQKQLCDKRRVSRTSHPCTQDD